MGYNIRSLRLAGSCMVGNGGDELAGFAENTILDWYCHSAGLVGEGRLLWVI